MAWYNITYSCGHEGRVNITGPTKNRQWIADREADKMCPECYKIYLEEQKEKANKKATEKAKEMELPQLTGSEKQVVWANTLRQNFIDKIEKFIDEEKVQNDWDFWQRKYPALKNSPITDLVIVRDYVLKSNTEAKYYIDNRNDRALEIISKELKNAIKTNEEIIEEKTEMEIKAECTIRPASSLMRGAAEITVKDDKVTVTYEKNDEFRMIVKSLGYSWDGIWIKNINELTGSAEDRAAEIGNKLLNAGFPIMIIDEKIREKAVKGEFKAECNRWIKLKAKGDYIGWLAVAWYDKSDMYDKARKLPGSRYSSPNIVVKVQNYKEIEDFANLYGFKFTRAALKAIEEYKEAEKKIEIVNPTKVEKEEPKDGLKEILNSSTDVLDDLKED